MLESLRVKNLAIVEDAAMKFGPGLNVITGETGAGKSILIGALGLLLGERADKTMVRTGEKQGLRWRPYSSWPILPVSMDCWKRWVLSLSPEEC